MMNLKNKLLNYAYVPIVLLILTVYFIRNGWSSWLGGLSLAGGLILGWFFLSFYPRLVSLPGLNLIFYSFAFQASFLLFSFWLVISSNSLLASGVVLGVNLFFAKELIFDYQKRPQFFKKRLFNDLVIDDVWLRVYLIAFVLSVAFLILLVLL
jgi:hypothetical protein